MKKASLKKVVDRLLEGESFADIYSNLTPEDFIDYSGKFARIHDGNDCNNYPGDLTVYSDDFIERVSDEEGDGVSFAICDPGLLSDDPQEPIPVVYCTVIFDPSVDPDWLDEHLLNKVKALAGNENSVKPLLNDLVDLPGFKSMEFEHDTL